MPFQAIPRERAFFDLLERSAANVAVAASELQELVLDLGSAPDHGRTITELEHAGDDLTHQIIALLNATFVTPMDRHDILLLASHLDDVLDSIEAVSDLLVLHRISEPVPQLRQQCEVLTAATRAVARAVETLRAPQSGSRDWAPILRLERDGDHIYRRGVAELYSGDYKAMDVLKWKDILSEMEQAIDRCEDIANTIESIVLKHA